MFTVKKIRNKLPGGAKNHKDIALCANFNEKSEDDINLLWEDGLWNHE